MSESMAFIGGVAVAGLAALVLLKGTNTPLQPNFAVTPQMPRCSSSPGHTATSAISLWALWATNYPNQPPVAPNSEQRVEMGKAERRI